MAKTISLEELQADYHKVTVDKIVPGALIRTVISTEEGLVFKDSRTEKPKRLIIIGVDSQRQICYGSVLVNTKPNPNLQYSNQFLDTQYVVRKVNYTDFLDYDSFADCAQVFSIPMNKILSGEYFGNLLEEDFNSVMSMLRNNRTMTVKEKKRFGIIKG